MSKCDCYHTEPKTRYTYHPITGSPIGHDIEVGVCWGTKECEQCDCGGDMTQCDFYPDVRKRGREKIKIEDAIRHFKHSINHDIYSEPVKSYVKLAVKALEKQLKEEGGENK